MMIEENEDEGQFTKKRFELPMKIFGVKEISGDKILITYQALEDSSSKDDDSP